MPPAVTPGTVTVGQLAGQWELDTRTSEIRIRHKTMWGLATVEGRFRSFEGGGSVGANGAVTGSVTIDAASIDTKNKKRDGHLRSSDFFDTQRFPSIVVQVSATMIRDGQAQVRSSLVIRGITERLTFTGQIEEATACFREATSRRRPTGNAMTLTTTFSKDEAATELSSDESRRYVNGILGRIAREVGRPETEGEAVAQFELDAEAD
jgi:polyisoprenoid-binding protein YceI